MTSPKEIARTLHLATVIKDPISHTPDLEKPDYSRSVNAVLRGKAHGQLHASSQAIEYRPNQQPSTKTSTAPTYQPVVFECLDIREVSSARNSVTIKSTSLKLKLKTASDNGPQIAGELYLNCPHLTR
jgi:hypothetical protein